jgi:tRNA(Ile)-lysidine synthase
MTDAALQLALHSVPPGRWALAVSGGADSVALLRLLSDRRPDLTLHVVHLNHETRGNASDEDAQFVRSLAAQLNLPATIERLNEVMPALDPLPANRSARYRAARLSLFRQTVVRHQLDGVILAHHRLDQAETVLLRLMRGSGPLGLHGMQPLSVNEGLTLLRPLLAVDPRLLRDALTSMGQDWREDASNASSAYRRNRVRGLLLSDDGLTDLLVQLGAACASLDDWVKRAAGPPPGPAMSVAAFDGLPPIVREQAARRWLASAGVPVDEINETVAGRLLTMMDDAASAGRVDFPGAVRIGRRRGTVAVVPEQASCKPTR